MNVELYFESLTQEINSLKNRVRNFTDSPHWLTDGEWKESVLRAIIKRHLPSSIKIGRGFVVNSHNCSKQMDVLLYDSTKPILFSDGDLIFITSDAVKGIIEVKSKVSKSNLLDTLNKLSNNSEFIRVNNHNLKNIFVGLFSYETNLGTNDSEYILESIKNSSSNNKRRIINNLSFGKSLLVRFWSYSHTGISNYNKWHVYNLINKAPGYFINNVIDHLAEKSVGLNQDLWFPSVGKEPNKIGEIKF